MKKGKHTEAEIIKAVKETENGRTFRVMNVLDDADRTVVAQEISMSMPAQRVVRLLGLLRIVT